MSWLSKLASTVASAARRVSNSFHGQELDPSSEKSVEEFLRYGLGAAAQTAAGEAVTSTSAARVAAVYRCVALLSDPIGTTRLELVRRDRNGVRTAVEDPDFHRLMEDEPNEWQTGFEFRTLMQRNVLNHGNGYARIVRDRAGRVTALVPLPPQSVEVDQRADWSLAYRYTAPNGRKRELASKDVLHLRNRGSDGVVGVSVLQAARETIGLALATERHGSTLFRNGARPASYLTTDGKISPERAAQLREQMDAYRGAGNAHKTLLLEEGMKFEPITMTAEDAQFIQTRQFTRAEIATFFGVPPHMIGDTERSTSWGSGIEQQTLGFELYSLRPWRTLWEQALKRSLLPGRRNESVMFDVADLLRGDAKAQADYYSKALQWGWLNPNEVRARLGLPPREGGEVYYLPPNETREAGAGMPEDISSELEELAA